MEITKFIKFHGNNKYLVGLVQTDDDKYMLVYGLIGQMKIKNEITTDRPFLFPFVEERMSTVEIPFIADNNHHLFNLIPLHNKDEYDTILSLLEVIYGE